MSLGIYKIPLSGGNVRNHPFYVRGAQELLPADCFGGKNASEAGRPVTIRFVPGETIETDVDGSKMILRNRSAVREFLELSAAKEGDVVLLELIDDRTFEVRLQELSE